ncbi:hypothetical protein IAU60_000856 [Kwoniella sp. DSM 27419]
MATSLAVPVAYITVLVTALAIFSRVYRKRRAAEKTSFEPWFPTHPQRETYITLLSSSEAVPDSLLKSALLVRAQTDVKRIWRLRDDKMALTQLHAKGLIGDDTMARFAAAEKELEAEIVDVVSEANTFRQGWGQLIFATATELAQAEKTRETVINIPKMKMLEDKRIALRNKYLPNSVPPPLLQTVAPPQTAATATAAAAATPPSEAPAAASNQTSPAGQTSLTGKVATPQKVASGTSTPATNDGSTSGVPSAESSKKGSPVLSNAQLQSDSAPGSGNVSSSSTPSKGTPSKKKGKKK